MCIRDRVYDVNYDRYTSYTENLNDDNGADNGGYTWDNYYRLEGTGMDLSLIHIFNNALILSLVV